MIIFIFVALVFAGISVDEQGKPPKFKHFDERPTHIDRH